MPAGDLRPWDENARTISPDRFENLRRAIAADPEFLRLRPILARTDGLIYCGNQRYSGQRSRAASEFAGKDFDVVVTTCDEATETCPFFPGARRLLHWSFPDLAAIDGAPEKRLAAFRDVRNKLRDAIAQEFGQAR